MTWDKTRIDTVLNKKLNLMPVKSVRERDIPLVSYAKEHYDEIVVFQAEFSCKGSVIDSICIADNDFPLDLYYIDDKSDVKRIVLTYRGNVELVYPRFVTLMKGLAKKEARAFRYIIKQQPELIFVCETVFGCFFYVKNNMVYVYDYYLQKKCPLKEHNRLTFIPDEVLP